MYLQKLSLFNLMPFILLTDIASRLTTKFYSKQSISKSYSIQIFSFNLKYAIRVTLEIACILYTKVKLIYK
jgi:hypothetical protein